MTPDEVIKEAIEKLEAAQHDAFVLGAYQTFKEAGATDEEAQQFIKSAWTPRDLAVLAGVPAAIGGSVGAAKAGEGRRGRGAAAGAALGVGGAAAGGVAGAVGVGGLTGLLRKIKNPKVQAALLPLVLSGTLAGAAGGAAGGGVLGGRLARKGNK